MNLSVDGYNEYMDELFVKIKGKVLRIRELMKKIVRLDVLKKALSEFGEVNVHGSMAPLWGYDAGNDLTHHLTASDIDLYLCVHEDTDWLLISDAIITKIAQFATVVKKRDIAPTKNMLPLEINGINVDILVVVNRIERYQGEYYEYLPPLKKCEFDYALATSKLICHGRNHIHLAIAIMRVYFPDSCTTFWKLGSFFVEKKMFPKRKDGMPYVKKHRTGVDDLLICLAELCNYVLLVSLYTDRSFGRRKFNEFMHFFEKRDCLRPFDCISPKHVKFAVDNKEKIIDWMKEMNFVVENYSCNEFSRFSVPVVKVEDMDAWKEKPKEEEAKSVQKYYSRKERDGTVFYCFSKENAQLVSAA